MTSHFADRILAVVYSLAMALLADLPATAALVVVCAAVLVLTVLAWQPVKSVFRTACRLVVRVEQWIAVHVAVHRLDEEIEQLYDAHAAAEPVVRHLPPGRELRRRMPGMRMPRRPRARQHTTSSSSDRRSR